MKKITILIVLGALSAMLMTANAQLFLKVNAGYAGPTSVTPFSKNNITATATTYSEELIASTTGGGINLGLTVGYNLTSNLGLELGVAQLNGSRTKAELNVPSQLGSVKTTIDQSTSQLRVMPSLVIRAGGEGINPYAKVGFLIPVSGATTTDINSMQAVPDGNGGMVLAPLVQTLETKGSFAIGYNSTVGIELGLGDKLKIFGEVAIQSLAIQGQSTTIIGLTVGGQDALPGLTTSGKVTNYVTTLTEKNNIALNPNFDENKPLDAIAPVAQYGSVGLNVGVILSL